jgi:hypothetical protein
MTSTVVLVHGGLWDAMDVWHKGRRGGRVGANPGGGGAVGAGESGR